MLLKKWSILLVLLTSGCVHTGPLVTFCLVDCPEDGSRCEMQCSTAGNEQTVPMKDANNFGCMPLDDWSKLLKYCKIKK